jgi:hypothetical protein
VWPTALGMVRRRVDSALLRTAGHTHHDRRCRARGERTLAIAISIALDLQRISPLHSLALGEGTRDARRALGLAARLLVQRSRVEWRVSAPECYRHSMPSRLHEALLLLFRNRPELAPGLLRDALHVTLPQYAEARIESAELTDVQPAEYRADLVVLLYDNKPVLGIVVEVQLAADEHKRYAWPVYATGLRARMRCPVCILVVTAQESVVRWAGNPIELGGGNAFRPFVIGPSGVPIITDAARAIAEPELAVLSAMAHGRSADPDMAVQVAAAAMAASLGLDPDRSVLYFDLVYASLSDAARASLQAMDPAKYEFQSEFAKRYLSQGRAEGEARVLSKQLTLKFGALDAATAERLRVASTAEIERWVERILTATTLDDVFR